MRYRLKTLLGVTTAVGLCCGLFFACPLVIELPLLLLLMLACPAVWVVGAFFAKGGVRAFFIGGIAAGWAPYSVVALYGGSVGASLFFSGDELWELTGWGGDELLLTRLAIAAAFLFPGLASFAGGGLGVLTYHWCAGEATAPRERAASSRLGEPYVLVESRVTPLPVPAAADEGAAR